MPVTPQVVQLQESNFLHELWLNLAQGGLWEGIKGIFGGLPLYLENVCHQCRLDIRSHLSLTFGQQIQHLYYISVGTFEYVEIFHF